MVGSIWPHVAHDVWHAKVDEESKDKLDEDELAEEDVDELDELEDEDNWCKSRTDLDERDDDALEEEETGYNADAERFVMSSNSHSFI